MRINKDETPKLQIKLEDMVEVICEKCACNIFTEGLMIRKISKFLTGTDQDSIAPMQVFYCVKCQHVNEQFLPKIGAQ